MASCSDPAPPLLVRGVHQFNAGEYFECHETLETLWMKEPGAVRELYQGILQIGVAFLKQGRGEYRGAIGLLRRGLAHLAPFEPDCQGIDVARLRSESGAVLRRLEAAGPAGAARIELGSLPWVHWLSKGANDDLA